MDCHIEVNFIKSNTIKETVEFTDAVTYNLVGGKIEKTKLKGEGEFVENIVKSLSTKKITMPNVKVGSVLEFQYIIKSPNVGSLKDFYFQSNLRPFN